MARIACVYCGKLLYPEKANWMLYDPSITYPLQQQVPDISLTFHPNTNRIPESRIPTCDSCTFLEPNNNDNNLNNDTMENQIHDETLKRAATWLSLNNPYLRPYAHILSSQSSEQNRNNPFPRARHIQSDTQAPPVNPHDIIFSEMLSRLLSSLNQQLTQNISSIIQMQMESLKLLPHVFPETAMLELPQDQYRALNTIRMYMGENDDNELKTRLKKIDTIIIEEVSMVSAELLDFISNVFANLHNNAIAFGGINVIVVGDLAQLPPVSGQQVFRAATWSLFYPLFLRTPQRQNNDNTFYQMLEEIRIDNISTETRNILQQRHSEFLVRSAVETSFNTTHIVGFKENAQFINTMICNTLPVPPNKFLLSQASDFVNSIPYDRSFCDKMFKPKTNLPSYIRIQPGARVMYLNNSLIEHGICNGTMGVITDVNPSEQIVRIAFSVR
ncbi:9760_t:CDS:2, partial [Rhizophagus irregularis]